MGRPRRSAASKAEMKTKAMLKDSNRMSVVAVELEIMIKDKTIRKVFPGHGVFKGKVKGVRLQGKKKVFVHVVYDDGDEEDLDVSEFVISCDDKDLRERVKTFALEKGLMKEEKRSRRCLSPVPKSKSVEDDYAAESEEDESEKDSEASPEIRPGLDRAGTRTPIEVDFCT